MSTVLHTARVALSIAALAAFAPAGATTPAAVPLHVAPDRTTPVAVKNVAPDDGATKVNLRQPVKIVFDGAVDPASVTRAHVSIMGHGQPLASSLSYDATAHRITVTPIGMANGVTYTLVVSGLVDSSGRAVTPFQSTFSTWLDPEVSEQTTMHSSDGQISMRVTTTLVDGRRTRRVAYSDPGADGVWGTADDYVFTYTNFVMRPDGQESSETSYLSPGPDGVWFTADDEVTSMFIYAYSAAGAMQSAELRFVTTGTGACCGWRQTFVYDAQGVQTGLTIDTPGADGKIGTADDDITTESFGYDAFGRLVSVTNKNASGTVGDYIVRTWSNLTDLASEVYYTPGPDGVAHTGDDVPYWERRRTYDKHHHLIRSTFFNSPGPDGVWNTADDGVENSQRFWYDDNDNLTKSTVYDAPGADGLWFTGDDLPETVSVFDTSR